VAINDHGTATEKVRESMRNMVNDLLRRDFSWRGGVQVSPYLACGTDP